MEWNGRLEFLFLFVCCVFFARGQNKTKQKREMSLRFVRLRPMHPRHLDD